MESLENACYECIIITNDVVRKATLKFMINMHVLPRFNKVRLGEIGSLHEVR